MGSTIAHQFMKREEQEAVIQELCLMDDIFFNVCFSDNIECTELLLNIILNRGDLKVERVRTQATLQSLRTRSVRLDAYVRDSQGRAYDIEVQRANEGAEPKRARYNSSLMDADISFRGEDFKDLPETYVIFITENDIYHYAIPVYEFERVCKQTQMNLQDGTHIVYVNGAYEGDSPIGKLMSDFRCTESDKVFYPALRRQVQYFKKTPEGVSHMCKAMEELQEKSIARAVAFGRTEGHTKGRAEGLAEGRTEGLAEGLKEGARINNLEKASKMLKLGKYSVEEIAEVFGLTIDEVEALREDKSEILM